MKKPRILFFLLNEREEKMAQNKKVLVTGAGGFIGSHLCEELIEKGYKVKDFFRYNSRNF